MGRSFWGWELKFGIEWDGAKVFYTRGEQTDSDPTTVRKISAFRQTSGREGLRIVDNLILDRLDAVT
jgi:hypothetical protein